MGNKPAVSVIIPCYQAEAHLARAIKSLFAQTNSDWEAVIVSDDGVDYKKVLVGAGIEDVRLKFFSTGKTGSGPGNARNVGLLNASANILANLDADDEWVPHYLETLLPYVTQYGFVLSNYVYFDDATNQFMEAMQHSERKKGIVGIQMLYHVIFSYTHVSFIYDRRRVPTEWVTDIYVSEDTLFLFNAYEYLDVIFTVPDPLYIYHKRSGSLTNHKDTPERFIRSKHDLLKKIRAGEIFSKNPFVSAVAERYFQESINAESEYGEALKTDENANFVTIFMRRMNGK